MTQTEINKLMDFLSDTPWTLFEVRKTNKAYDSFGMDTSLIMLMKECPVLKRTVVSMIETIDASEKDELIDKLYDRVQEINRELYPREWHAHHKTFDEIRDIEHKIFNHTVPQLTCSMADAINEHRRHSLLVDSLSRDIIMAIVRILKITK